MASKKLKTRHSSGSCFGPPCVLPDVGSLYTKRDVLAACQMEKVVHPDNDNRWYASQVAPDIRKKFADANPLLVVIANDSLVNKIAKDIEKASKVNRNKLKKKEKDIFMKNMNKMYDILKCHCPIIKCESPGHNSAHCHDGAHITCVCPRSDKIPAMELRFIMDQRDKEGLLGGGMQMGQGVDVEESKRQQKKAEREIKQQLYQDKRKELAELAELTENVQMEAEDDATIVTGSSNEGMDSEFKIEEKKDYNQHRMDITLYAAEVMRNGVSARAGAALYNAALKCHGLISETDTKLVCDKNKLRRAMDMYAAEQKDIKEQNIISFGGIQCIGSDGKRDKKTRTCEIQLINGKPQEKFTVKPKEHISYTQEPPGEYLCHSEVGKGTGRDLATDYMEVVVETSSVDSLLAALTDGTVVNTGWKDGMIAHVERDLKKNLLWLICLLHENELGLRHVFCQLDGGFGTSGPNSFKGELGKACVGEIHQLEVTTFNQIETSLKPLDDKIWKDLSRDQQLLYRYVMAVATGTVSETLVGQVAGPINHSRWLTLAIRLLQLYTRTENPTTGLDLVTKFIVQVYAPSWFTIKSHSKFTAGPSNLFHQMKLLQTQSQEVQAVVKCVIQRNGYFSEPGVMVCCMLESQEESVRRKAVDIVKKTRAKPPKAPRARVLKGIRKFVIPPLQWTAEVWWEMIDWTEIKLYEPEILRRIDLEQLEMAISQPLSFPNFPCHSQSVERTVKLVTEAASQVCGQENRHSRIISVLASRKARKSFESKKQYSYKT